VLVWFRHDSGHLRSDYEAGLLTPIALSLKCAHEYNKYIDCIKISYRFHAFILPILIVIKILIQKKAGVMHHIATQTPVDPRSLLLGTLCWMAGQQQAEVAA